MKTSENSIVLIGGGFAVMNVAKELLKSRVQIEYTLIDYYLTIQTVAKPMDDWERDHKKD